MILPVIKIDANPENNPYYTEIFILNHNGEKRGRSAGDMSTTQMFQFGTSIGYEFGKPWKTGGATLVSQ